MAKMLAAHPLEQFFEKLKTPVGKGVSVKSIEGRGIVQVFAAKGKKTAVQRALKIKETPGKVTVSEGMTAIPLAPAQWMLISSRVDAKGTFGAGIAAKLKANGHVSEQSDSRVIFRLSGPRAKELLQKGCRLDLHESVTGKGWCAQTQIAQMGVMLHQVDDKPTYDVFVFSGFARDFAEWLEHTGAQLGISFSR